MLATIRGIFWGLYARWYDLIWDSPLTQHAGQRADQALPHRGHIVEFGSGTGLMLRHLERDGRRLTGVELSPLMAAQSRTGSTLIADATATPLPGTCADGVLIANLLHLVSDPAAVLAEAARVAAPGAVLVIITPRQHLTAAMVCRAERRLGRSYFETLRADFLRRVVGVLAILTGVSPSQRIHKVLAENSASIVWDDPEGELIADTQRVLIGRFRSDTSRQIAVPVPDSE